MNVRLAEISDDWQDWLDLEGVKQGKLKVRVEKLYPSDDKVKKLRSDVESSRLVQFYVGELKGENLFQNVANNEQYKSPYYIFLSLPL